MNLEILNTKVQEFISLNLNSDINTLLLKGNSVEGVPITRIVEQIEAKRKCKTKLPTWFNTEGIYYPNKLNIEQTSSEITAQYKSNLISGERIIDLTGGFGVDCYFFSKQFFEVIHTEINTTLSHIAKHNAEKQDATSIRFEAQDGITYLKNSKYQFDWIYIDPSRRHDVKGKVFFLKDCIPDVPSQLDILFSKSENILIKTSPLLDITVGLKELTNVAAIHIVAVKNEVKELLWLLKKDHKVQPEITAVNLVDSKLETFTFTQTSEQKAKVTFNEPLQYLYEPNAAILKSGAFKLIAQELHIYKLALNTHLYTSEAMVDFPGRVFTINEILPYHKKQLKKVLPKKANVTTRNFPETVKSIRNLFKIRDGGDCYLFFTTNNFDKKIVLVCSKAL